MHLPALVEEALARVREGEARAPQQPQKQPQKKQEKKKKKKGAPREFDFSRFGTRHIALQLAYEGDRYLGFSTRVRLIRDQIDVSTTHCRLRPPLNQSRPHACAHTPHSTTATRKRWRASCSRR